jgi:hypothetical protein
VQEQSSIRITERHYSPWIQEQFERDVRGIWSDSETQLKGISEVHGTDTRAN